MPLGSPGLRHRRGSEASSRCCSSPVGDRIVTGIPSSIYPSEFAPMRKVVPEPCGPGPVASPAFAGIQQGRQRGRQGPDLLGHPRHRPTAKRPASPCRDIKEDVVVLVFLGNHCPVVQAYDDRIIDFINDYKGKNVKVVGVASTTWTGSPPGDQEVHEGEELNYIYGYDESQAIGRAYGATNTPQFFVLDKDRIIRYIGAMDDNAERDKVKKNYLRDAVDALLDGKAPAVERDPPQGLRHQVQEQLSSNLASSLRRSRSDRLMGIGRASRMSRTECRRTHRVRRLSVNLLPRSPGRFLSLP